MSYTKNLIHAVWRTKHSYPFIKGESKELIYNHIKENARELNIGVLAINGVADHIHCLIDLPPTLTMSDALQRIKGECSYWINKEKIFKTHFQWGSRYYGMSIGLSEVSRILNYIARQEEHHRKETYQEEVDRFIKEYGLAP